MSIRFSMMCLFREIRDCDVLNCLWWWCFRLNWIDLVFDVDDVLGVRRSEVVCRDLERE